MELKRRNTLIYGVLLGIWLLVVAWQVEEHLRVEAAAKTDLLKRSTDITDTLSAVVRALRFRGEAVAQDRLELILNELANTRANELAGSLGVISIALLNTNGDPFITAGNTNLIPKEALTEGELWTRDYVTVVNPVWGNRISAENASNATVVFPPFREFSNSIPPGERFDRRERPPGDTNFSRNMTNRPPSNAGAGHGGFRRPPWYRGSDEDFRALIAGRELHGLVLTMSTENLRAISLEDLWMRAIVVFFAGISALGVGLAWRNIAKTSELQIRLVRASELNSHLKEMNLAAAGLAHETRNPLNIIRGMAQMISKSNGPSDLRDKSRAIVDEADKVTAQLNEFINYSRPREVRRAKIALNAAVTEVVRALNYDIEEKKIRVEIKIEPLFIEADEQLLRQALFNLLLNSVQAVAAEGQIQFIARAEEAAGASLEIRDDGPGVAPEHRGEIFKPYFTTHQKGTGLGLAVVQQIVRAQGWEIQYESNDPKGAVFRISHLKVVA